MKVLKVCVLSLLLFLVQTACVFTIGLHMAGYDVRGLQYLAGAALGVMPAVLAAKLVKGE